MNDQPPARNTEEEWILKYRAAMNAQPVKESLGKQLAAAFENACSSVVSTLDRVVARWLSPRFLRLKNIMQVPIVRRPSLKVPPEKIRSQGAQEGRSARVG